MLNFEFETRNSTTRVFCFTFKGLLVSCSVKAEEENLQKVAICFVSSKVFGIHVQAVTSYELTQTSPLKISPRLTLLFGKSYPEAILS